MDSAWITGPAPPRSADRDDLDRLLDEALVATFPASDPVAISARDNRVVREPPVGNQDSNDT